MGATQGIRAVDTVALQFLGCAWLSVHVQLVLKVGVLELCSFNLDMGSTSQSLSAIMAG